MSEPIKPEEIESEPSQLCDKAFSCWILTGITLAVLSIVASALCPRIPPSERSFRLVVPGPQAEKLQKYDRWAQVLEILFNGAIGYAVVGILIFIRRGCVVIPVAAGVTLVTFYALLDATWVPF